MDIEINGIECNDNGLLSDFIAEFHEFIYDHTLLIISEINILNRSGLLSFELEIRTDWAQSIHWDGTQLNNETEKIVQSYLGDKLKRKISTESIDYWIELKGCKKSVIEYTGLSISLFDERIKEFLEFNLEDQDKALICNKINDLFSLELPSHEEEYLLSIFDNHIDSFIVYLPNKVNVELMIKM